ncbi:MAG: ArsR/SmtB family transcription factor, partial [Solirubrobacteraceae bacterium]
MQGDADVAAAAALMGERTRARFLLALLDGRGLRAGELARLASISRATASFHLEKLLAGGMVSVEPHGRNRTYRLAGPQVAEAIEALARIAAREQTSSLSATTAAEKLAYARFCYDHLAGALAIKLVDAMTIGGLLTGAEEHFELTDLGA